MPSILAVATMLALAGCAGMSIDDAVPAGARSSASAPVVGTGPSAPRQTGEFPNLNIVPKPATAQFTDAETSATTSELRLAQERARRTVQSLSAPGEGERLRVLGNTHGAAVLGEIEAR
ncbi:hypothetical protein EJC49_10530 [Aquibium carbonis]|uniref:Uncharacterized protein n=1 Tax=Aquibium carbonis TaxID=2495581 RepID=A0A3R9Y9T4_9HYPH|nr:hypothetical protein [Aquibium carbonis]RST86413.1 hypothetical protein EJC49_10530 [Aquibium carbonis]